MFKNFFFLLGSYEKFRFLKCYFNRWENRSSFMWLILFCLDYIFSVKELKNLNNKSIPIQRPTKEKLMLIFISLKLCLKM